MIKTTGLRSHLIVTVTDKDVSVAHILLKRRLKHRMARDPASSQIRSQGSRPVPDPQARIRELRVLQAASLTQWVWRMEETLKDKISQGFGNQATRQATSETSFPFEGRSRKKPKRN